MEIMNTQRDKDGSSESYAMMKYLAFGAFSTNVISYRKVATGKKYTLIHI